MIASALRNEIERFYAGASDAVVHSALARGTTTAQRVVRGLRVGAPEEQAPSLRALVALVERSLGEPAEHLAYQAACEYMATRVGLESGDPDRVEAALDAVDELVEDPADLPRLRERLRVFLQHFEQLCKESSDERRRQPFLRVSAA